MRCVFDCSRIGESPDPLHSNITVEVDSATEISN